MKLALSSLVPTFIFAIAASTSSVEGKLRGLSELGSYLIGEKKADSSCETKDIDVCIAIDRSGTFECAIPPVDLVAARITLILSSPLCCRFHLRSRRLLDRTNATATPTVVATTGTMVREFTNAFIDGIDESGKVNQFAVVRFASTAGKQVRHYIISVADVCFVVGLIMSLPLLLIAGVEIPLANSAKASDVVTNLRYTSGYTNTAGALKLCRELLQGSTADQKAILLLTDGQPTRPKAPEGSSSTNYDYAREQALEQATIAKDDEDTSIIGVFVKTSSSTSSFLEKLASPALFFEVPDFENLDQVTTSVVDLVHQCPPPPPAPHCSAHSTPSYVRQGRHKLLHCH